MWVSHLSIQKTIPTIWHLYRVIQLNRKASLTRKLDLKFIYDLRYEDIQSWGDDGWSSTSLEPLKAWCRTPFQLLFVACAYIRRTRRVQSFHHDSLYNTKHEDFVILSELGLCVLLHILTPLLDTLFVCTNIAIVPINIDYFVCSFLQNILWLS